MNYESKLIIPFSYVVTGVLTSGSTVQSTLTLAADSSFELMCFLASSTYDSADDVAPNLFSVQIQDQSTGRLLSNARVPQRCFGGVTANGWGAVEKYPIRFPANCTLLFDFLELASQSQTATIVLKGYKLFNAS